MIGVEHFLRAYSAVSGLVNLRPEGRKMISLDGECSRWARSRKARSSKFVSKRPAFLTFAKEIQYVTGVSLPTNEKTKRCSSIERRRDLCSHDSMDHLPRLTICPSRRLAFSGRQRFPARSDAAEPYHLSGCVMRKNRIKAASSRRKALLVPGSMSNTSRTK